MLAPHTHARLLIYPPNAQGTRLMISPVSRASPRRTRAATARAARVSSGSAKRRSSAPIEGRAVGRARAGERVPARARRLGVWAVVAAMGAGVRVRP